MSILPLLPQFDTEPFDSGKRWRKYLKRFVNLLEALDLKEDRRKKALLLHYSGKSVQSIFETFTDHASWNYAQTVKALTGYFQQKKDTSVETCNFENKTRKPREDKDHFCTHSKQRKRRGLRSSPDSDSHIDRARNSSLPELKRDPEPDDKANKRNVAHCKRTPREGKIEYQTKEREHETEV